jgi:hypothetical protein
VLAASLIGLWVFLIAVFVVVVIVVLLRALR